MSKKISIVLPARNEADSLKTLLPELKEKFPEAEIIVVDDGSTDDTAGVCRQHGVRVLSHVYSMGNGAAIKTGARKAEGDILVFMDTDGQHDPADIQPLIDGVNQGYDMMVGARHLDSHASLTRRIEYDLHYIRNWSLLYDVRILVMTVWKGLSPPRSTLPVLTSPG